MTSLWGILALFSTVQAYVLSTTQQHCVDHYLMFKYDGNGHVLIAGADPYVRVIFRADCYDYPQGWLTSVSFDVTKFSDQNIMVTVSGDDGDVQCLGSMYINIHTEFEYIITNCVWGNSGAQFPMVTTSIAFENPPALSESFSSSITSTTTYSRTSTTSHSRTPTTTYSITSTTSYSSTPMVMTTLFCRQFHRYHWD